MLMTLLVFRNVIVDPFFDAGFSLAFQLPLGLWLLARLSFSGDLRMFNWRFHSVFPSERVDVIRIPDFKHPGWCRFTQCSTYGFA